MEEETYAIEGKLISYDSREIKGGKYILKMFLSDLTNAIACKAFLKKKEFEELEPEPSSRERKYQSDNIPHRLINDIADKYFKPAIPNKYGGCRKRCEGHPDFYRWYEMTCGWWIPFWGGERWIHKCWVFVKESFSHLKKGQDTFILSEMFYT